MNERLRVFVSSVQKELEDERLTVQNLINTDPFLSAHALPVLYEYEPAAPENALEGCLKALDGCQVCLIIVAAQYGTRVGGLSITHAEYRRAKGAALPVLAFIKGERSAPREDGTKEFLQEIDGDALKYKRFVNVIELQKEVRAALVKLMRERFGIAPTSDENETAAQTIEAASHSNLSLSGECDGQIWTKESRVVSWRQPKPCSRNSPSNASRQASSSGCAKASQRRRYRLYPSDTVSG